MLRTAGQAKKRLNDAGRSVISFVGSLYSGIGGYRGRGEQGDLYYTVFAMEILLALDAELLAEGIEAYLRSFRAGETLDLVHLACLARCWANLPGKTAPSEVRTGILDRIEGCRRGDGGYSGRPEDEHSTVYHGFLALCAYQDLGKNLPDAPALAGSVLPGAGDPTPVLAGAVVLLRNLGISIADVVAGAEADRLCERYRTVAGTVAQRLLDRYHEEGGFFAIPQVPLPDLLSTATALHALAVAGVSLDAVRTSCLAAYVTSLWSDLGGFRGMAGDDEIDCEYTYYGLLALGQLAP